MRSAILALLPRKQKRWLKGVYERLRLRWVAAFRSYGEEELTEALRAVGIREGDTVLLHAGFSPGNGFQGTTRGVTDTLLRALGSDGTLMMVSLPYRGSSLDYLQGLDTFDVRKTPSRMGLISEFFRRREGVVRSLHPTHPMVALGPRAEWLVDGHEACPYGCGPGSPFDKAVQVHAKVLFYDAPFKALTFFHWLEDHVRKEVGLPLYAEPPFQVRVVDADGIERTVTAYAYSKEIIRRRRFPVLEAELRKRGIIRTRRVGNTMLHAADLDDIVACVDDMTSKGRFFYDMS